MAERAKATPEQRAQAEAAGYVKYRLTETRFLSVHGNPPRLVRASPDAPAEVLLPAKIARYEDEGVVDLPDDPFLTRMKSDTPAVVPLKDVMPPQAKLGKKHASEAIKLDPPKQDGPKPVRAADQ